MDVSAEAKRIMAVSITKLYASRTQRGGLRLHRSLLISMVMRCARDIYHTACIERENEEQAVLNAQEPATVEPMDTGREPAEVSDLPPTPVPADQTTPSKGEALGLEEDKENHSPVEPNRYSRKRRGKTAVEPDFLPLKKARMESEEERQCIQGAALRTCNGNSCRPMDTGLTTLPVSQAIGAC